VFILFQSIDVEFEGRSPEVTDFHCIKQLLQQLFLKAPVNLSDMTSVLIHQTNIGSVIKVHNLITQKNAIPLFVVSQKCNIVNLCNNI